MLYRFVTVYLCAVISGTFGFLLVPEELPSVLSIFYSNIPPIKKGTDSRIGLGFRLGPNADFQVQFELGPQTNTQPIGPNAAASSASKKRQTFFAHKENEKKFNFTNNPNNVWINRWRETLEKDSSSSEDELQQHPNPLLYSMDPTRQENNHLVTHLKKLYEKSSNEISSNEKES